MRSINTSSLHVFDLLRLLARAEGAMGVSEISRAMQLSPSTVHRALATLEAAEYVRRADNATKYAIGLMPQFLGRAMLNRYPLRTAAAGILRELSKHASATTSLSVRLGWYALRINVVHGATDIYHRNRMGEVELLHQQVSGLALLAGLSSEMLQRYRRFVRQLDPAAAGLINRTAFTRDLARSDAEGWLVRTQSDGSDPRLAMSVRHDGQTIASLALVGAVLEVDKSGAPAPAPTWLAARDALEAEIAARPELALDPYAHQDADTIRLATDQGR